MPPTRSYHLNGVIFVSNKPLDRVRINRAFPKSVMREKGQQSLLLLLPNQWTCPLLWQIVIFGIGFSLKCGLRAHIRSWSRWLLLLLTSGSCLPHQNSLPAYVHFWKSNKMSYANGRGKNRSRRTKRLTVTGRSVQPSDLKSWLWTTAKSVKGVEGDQILLLPFF